MYHKYALLLVEYCLFLKPGEKLYISSTTLAEPLIREVYREATKRGVHVEVNMNFSDMNKIFTDNAPDDLLDMSNPVTEFIMSEFDAYLSIRAPFNLREDQQVDRDKMKRKAAANSKINQLYFDRTATGSLKRSLCQFPTQASAQEAGMSLEEYEDFVFKACKLDQPDPVQAWKDLGSRQQSIVDLLNNSAEIRYVNDRTDISFSVAGRTWINSDGKSNMPSGEVFTGPVEDSLNGVVFFDYPSIYSGHEVRNIELTVRNGEIVAWNAEVGGAFLDAIFEIEGSRFFGEVAIGTNYGITKATKNILFDEKIGGTIHMAIGQSYKQTGGKNQSSIHWDMIADMTKNGAIYADGVKIYENGSFVSKQLF